MTIHEDGVDDLLDAPAVLSVVSGAAVAVSTAASAIAPDGGAHRGVKESYKATKAVREPDRIVATAYSDDDFAHLVEWGSVNNPAYAPLRRGAERVGLRTKLARKGER